MVGSEWNAVLEKETNCGRKGSRIKNDPYMVGGKKASERRGSRKENQWANPRSETPGGASGAHKRKGKKR